MEKFFIKNFVKGLSQETFIIRFWDGEECIIGDGNPKFKFILNKHLDKKNILDDAQLALGEAYMAGDIELEGNLQEILDSFFNSTGGLFKNKAISKIVNLKGTSIKKQKKDISYHYDIGNDFYSLWLDKTMSYSCAYFKSESDTLYDAQMNKIHHILKKLNLKEDQTLLDVGCGWGYLLIEAAKMYKVKGLGITLSKEQFKKFNERIIEEGLQDYLEVKLMDYRDLEKSNMKFDRIVSVGMLEHVGSANIPLYFKNIDAVQKEGGIFLLHYISGLIEAEGNRWIKEYIFPGGYIPSLREVFNCAAEHNMHLVDAESLRLHYMKTLLCWRENFENALPRVEKMFDEKFIRMWRIYLAACAEVFHHGVCDIHQLVFTKDINNELPITRDYLYK